MLIIRLENTNTDRKNFAYYRGFFSRASDYTKCSRRKSERERFKEISISVIKNNQQRARNLFEVIALKNTRKAIKLLNQGVSSFVVDWQCGFAPDSHNMVLHWIALTGNVRLMCEIIACYI